MTGYRTLLWLLSALLFLALSGCGPCMMRHRQCGEGCNKQAMQNCQMKNGQMQAMPAAAPAVEAADRKDVLYSCNCGPACKCNTVSTTPGNCACGKPLVWGHVIKVEGDEALLCTCKEGCHCQLDPKDPTRCGCGNPVKRVSLKGSGLFFCNCGGSCTCDTVSTQPGPCRCGMMLKKAE